MDSANECQSCNCHGHARDCYYDPEVDRRNASQNQDHVYQGGGVCIDCQHHTTGINCEQCLPGFYRSPDHPGLAPRLPPLQLRVRLHRWDVRGPDRPLLLPPQLHRGTMRRMRRWLHGLPALPPRVLLFQRHWGAGAASRTDCE